MNIRGVSEAIATYIGSDIHDVRENRYHFGRTGTLQVYTIGEDYMTACKAERKSPPKCHNQEYNYDWECIENDFFGWKIFTANKLKSE